MYVFYSFVNCVLGFKWCGPGNLSVNGEIGIFSASECCHQHDRCDKIWEPFASHDGLTNPSKYTLSKCTCDDTLLACLKELHFPAHVISLVFRFNVPQCALKADYILECETISMFGRCLKYKTPRFRSGKKFWQLRDNPPVVNWSFGENVRQLQFTNP